MDLQHLKERDRSDDWYDLDTWREFAKANLLGIALPESVGGLGFGFVDLCMVLREVGRNVAPLPMIPTLVSAALPIARYGTDAQQAILSKVVGGRGAAHGRARRVRQRAGGAGDDRDARRRRLAARRAQGQRARRGVGRAHRRARARSTTASACSSCPANATGVTLERQEMMNHEPLFELKLDGVQVGDDALLGTPEQGSEILAFTLNRTTVATCALVSGVADKALRLTAQYTTERKQFDRAIGTFQAVGQRMADCYIDNQAIELTMLQAATHLDEGRDDPLEVATAKFWAAEGGNRIAHAALHIHGGVSIDVDFPIHRYFLWLKRYEFTLGSATPELLRIGEVLADTPVAP